MGMWAAARNGWDGRMRPIKVSIDVDSSKVQRLRESGYWREVCGMLVGPGSEAMVDVVACRIPSIQIELYNFIKVVFHGLSQNHARKHMSISRQ